MAEKADRSNGTIVSQDILFPKTKGTVIPQAEWSWSSEESVNVSQGRTNVNIQSTPVEWAVRKGGGASPAIQGLTDHLLGRLSHVCSQCYQSSSAPFSEWLPKQWCEQTKGKQRSTLGLNICKNQQVVFIASDFSDLYRYLSLKLSI